MASEYLRKSIADRRTGANLIGINVDTNNMRDLTPEFEMAFNQLEAFAKQTDEIKINSEKKKIQLEIEKSRLEFKDKYLSDPSVYSSQEKWDNVSRLYEEERKNAKKRISESKYLSSDEKALYSENIDLDFKRSWLDPKLKRNSAVAQKRVETATMLLETAVNNACLDDLYKTDTIDNFIKQAGEIYNPLIKLGISTDGDKNKAIIKGMSSIEGTRLSRKLESDILYNPMLSEEQKKAEISKAIETLKNPQRINDITENMTKEFGYDNYEKEYLKSSLKAQYENASIELDKKLYNLSVQNKTQKSLEALQKKENNIDNKMMKAVEKNDPFEYMKVKYDLDLTTKEALAIENSHYHQEMTGYTFPTFADPDNPIIGRVVSDEGISEIKGAISLKTKDGTEEVKTQDRANCVEEYIAKNYTKQGDDNAMRKDLGNRIPGLNPTVLLKGKENPLYYTTWDILKKGEDNKFKVAKNGNPLGLSGDAQKNYNKLLSTPINEKGDTLNTVKGKQVLNRFFYGYMEMNKVQDAKLEKRMEKPEKALQYILENDDVFENFKEMLPILYTLKVSPVNYSEAKLFPYERQATKQSEVEEDDGENAIYGA